MMPGLPAGGILVSVGCDVIEVQRVAGVLARQGERFRRRVFTPGEETYCEGHPYPARHYAARFAAKEAASKAFTTGIGARLGWTSVSVRHGERGEPLAVLDEKARRLLAEVGATDLLLSLSHTDTTAMAVAALVRDPAPRPWEEPAPADPAAPVRIGVVNVSDRAAAGVYEDLPGRAVVELLREWLATPFEVEYAVVPDERPVIAATLCRFADERGCCLVVTTGGTGPSVRDVTPEATATVCSRLLPGLGEAMRAASLRVVPTAILSRQTAGVRGRTVIVNLPGRPRAIRDNLEAIFPALPYAIDLVGGPRLEARPEGPVVYRPPSR